MKRAIVLFPGFDNIPILQRMRENYDPLANYIGPHITLVFPFESDCSTDDLKAHLRTALKGIKKFPVRLNGFSGDFRDGYLFLNVKEGNDRIILLHDRLYCGILQDFLFRKVTFCPHLTVGRLLQPDEFDKALDELNACSESFHAVIDRIYLENIDALEHSTIEFSFDLE